MVGLSKNKNERPSARLVRYRVGRGEQGSARVVGSLAPPGFMAFEFPTPADYRYRVVVGVLMKRGGTTWLSGEFSSTLLYVALLYLSPWYWACLSCYGQS